MQLLQSIPYLNIYKWLKRYMKSLIYTKLILLLFLSCNNSSKRNEEREQINIKICYVGIIDKPLPTLIFFDKGEENFRMFDYSYELNYRSYLEFKKEIRKHNIKKRESSSLIHVSINKKQNYYLDKKNSLSFLSKLLEITEYKNNKQLENQLKFYFRVVKSQ